MKYTPETVAAIIAEMDTRAGWLHNNFLSPADAWKEDAANLAAMKNGALAVIKATTKNEETGIYAYSAMLFMDMYETLFNTWRDRATKGGGVNV